MLLPSPKSQSIVSAPSAPLSVKVCAEPARVPPVLSDQPEVSCGRLGVIEIACEAPVPSIDGVTVKPAELAAVAPAGTMTVIWTVWKPPLAMRKLVVEKRRLSWPVVTTMA